MKSVNTVLTEKVLFYVVASPSTNASVKIITTPAMMNPMLTHRAIVPHRTAAAMSRSLAASFDWTESKGRNKSYIEVSSLSVIIDNHV